VPAGPACAPGWPNIWTWVLIAHGCGDAATTVPIVRYRPELSIFTPSAQVAQLGNIACGIT
jgi:hypothetical protein